MYNAWVISRRLQNTSGFPMQIAVDFPGSWTDATNQGDITQYQLMIAEGQVEDLPNFNVLAGATFPGIAVAANANSCLIGFELIDEFYDVTSSNMDSEIGAVDRANFLSYIDAKWNEKVTDIQTATTDGMTRRAFVDALIAAFSDPPAPGVIAPKES